MHRFLVFVLVGTLLCWPVVRANDEAMEEEEATDPPEAEAEEDAQPALALEADPDAEETVTQGMTDAMDAAVTEEMGASPEGTEPPSSVTTAAPVPCARNETAVLMEKRECRSYCSEYKKCRNTKADCLCDGACGMVCILPEMKCPKPQPLENGEVLSGEGVLFGATITYKCNEEYELIGAKERICRGDQKWSEKEPFCTIKGVRCTEPPFRIENGTADVDLTRNEFFIGEKVSFKCDEGFAAEEDDITETECELIPPDSAEWTNITMTCSPLQCQTPPSIDKGTFEEQDYYFGDSVVYKCDPGYQILDEPTRQCLADQTWGEDVPVCEESKIKCPEPKEPERGKVTYESLAFGYTLTYECELGYKVNGSSTRECTEEAEWSDEEPECVALDCGEPDEPRNGTIIFLSGTGFNAQVDFTCDENTTPSGPTSAVCEKEEEWNPPIPTCLQHCEIEELDNAYMLFKGVTKYQRYNMIPPGVFLPHNSTAQLICDEGYEVPSNESFLLPKSTADCDDGTWMPTTECIEARCFCEEIEYPILTERNLLLAKECTKPLASGEEYEFKCDPTFPEMKAVGTLQCQQKSWIYPNDTDVRCVLKSCSVKDIRLDHGNILKDNEDWLPEKDNNIVPNGTVLSFECTEDGYELHVAGKPVAEPLAENVTTSRECHNGTWSKRMPVCRPARCICNDLNETLPERGLQDVDCDFIGSGDLLQLECLSNFGNPSGLLVGECQAGKWKPLTAECQKVCNCEDLVANLTDTSMTLSAECKDFVDVNETIALDCAPGFENMTGDPQAFCLDGSWVLPDAYCNATIVSEDEEVTADTTDDIMNTTSTPDMESLNTTSSDEFDDANTTATTDLDLDIENTTDSTTLEEELTTAITKTECIFTQDSRQVFAYHEGNLLPEGDHELLNGSVVLLRCSNIYSFRLEGSSKLECVNGRWSDIQPRCQSLTPNIWSSAPPMWLVTDKPGYPPITEEGSVVITRNTNLQISCLWFHERPLMSIEGSVQPITEKSFNYGRLAGWTFYFDRLREETSFKFTCATPHSDPKKQLAHTITVKVGDICYLNEVDFFMTHGVRPVAATRKVVYTEGDQLRLNCTGGNLKKAFQYMDCTKGGLWEYGPTAKCE